MNEELNDSQAGEQRPVRGRLDLKIKASDEAQVAALLDADAYAAPLENE